MLAPLPAVVLLVLSSAALRTSGVSFASQALYTTGLCWGILLPGFLVAQGLVGRQRSLIAAVSIAFVTGLALQLVAWAIFVFLGIGHLLVVWPALVLGLFLAVPKLRGHLKPQRYRERIGPVAAWWSVTALISATTFALRTSFAATDLPPGPSQWYPDMYWYLGASAELARAIPPQVAQTAGEPFLYHWFSQAHMAAMHLSTGVPLPEIVVRLWLLPLLCAAAGMALTLARLLTGRWWPGAVATTLICASTHLQMAPWLAVPGYATMTFYSPSQIFGIPVLLLVSYLLITILGHQAGGGHWVLLALALLLCTGAKSSLLPIIVCGLALVVALSVVARRRGWEVPTARNSLLALLLSVGALLFGLLLSSAGSAGAGLQLFGIFRDNPFLRSRFGPARVEHYHDSILYWPDLLPGALIVGATLLSYLIASAPLWLVPLKVWRQPAAWLLFGIGFAGWSAMMLLNHDGLSQAYFMRGSVVAWHALAAWGVGARVQQCADAKGPGRTAAIALLGAIAGVLVLLALWSLWPTLPTVRRIATYWAMLGAFTGVGVLLAAVTRWWRPWGWTFVCGAVCAASVARRMSPTPVPPGENAAPLFWTLGALTLVAVALLVRPRWWREWSMVVALVSCGFFASTSVAQFSPQRTSLGAGAVTAAEDQAAAWLRQNAGQFDVVATNLHCTKRRTVPHCDTRQFWVSGLSERRVLIEGWAYTEGAHRMHGQDGYSSRQQPFHDEQLFNLNESAFYSPSDEAMAALRQHGVRWLFAHTGAGTLSANIAEFATERAEFGPVRIYELR